MTIDGYGRELDPIPAPVRIEDLSEVLEFEQPLLQATRRQWEDVLERLEPVDELPPGAAKLAAWELPANYGVLIDPFFGCLPGCEPMAFRHTLCSGGYDPAGYTPDPDCWFSTRCTCEGGGFVEREVPPEECDHSACQLQFVCLEDVATGLCVFLLECRPASSACPRCYQGVARSGGGWVVGCVCNC